jgi:hypothetical protein
MPRLPLEIGVYDYLRIAEDAEAKGISPLEQIQYVFLLGLVASGGSQHQEVLTDPQLMTLDGAAAGAAA